MKKINYVTMVQEKITDLKSEIAKMKVNDVLSKNTRGTQLYKLGRERRVLHLIHSLLELIGDVELSSEDRETLILITTLSSERSERTSVVCQEGDDILDLMQKYSEKKDLQRKLNAYCEKNGLKLNYTTGKVEKVS